MKGRTGLHFKPASKAAVIFLLALAIGGLAVALAIGGLAVVIERVIQ